MPENESSCVATPLVVPVTEPEPVSGLVSAHAVVSAVAPVRLSSPPRETRLSKLVNAIAPLKPVGVGAVASATRPSWVTATHSCTDTHEIPVIAPVRPNAASVDQLPVGGWLLVSA